MLHKPRRGAAWRRAALLIAGLAAGCATTFDNAPQNGPAHSLPAPPQPGTGRAAEDSGETAIALSLSGGGLRAAAFALAVLRRGPAGAAPAAAAPQPAAK